MREPLHLHLGLVRCQHRPCGTSRTACPSSSTWPAAPTSCTSTLNDFRLFLEHHAAVLRALRAWTVRVIISMQFRHFEDMAQRVKQDFFTQLVVPAYSPARIEKIRLRFKDVRPQVYPLDFGPTDQYVEDRDYLAAAPRCPT